MVSNSANMSYRNSNNVNKVLYQEYDNSYTHLNEHSVADIRFHQSHQADDEII